MPYVEYDETEAVCPQCGSVFRSVEVLEEHLRGSHEGPGTGAAEQPRRRVSCSVCGASFGSVETLQQHNRGAHVA